MSFSWKSTKLSHHKWLIKSPEKENKGGDGNGDEAGDKNEKDKSQTLDNTIDKFTDPKASYKID